LPVLIGVLVLLGAVGAALVFKGPELLAPFETWFPEAITKAPAGPPNPAPSANVGGPTGSRQPTELQEARAQLAASRRLQPDQRFVAACGEIARMAGQTPGPAAVAVPVDGAWEIRCDKERAGSVKECPSFEELSALLTQWAKKKTPAAPPASVKLDELRAAVEGFWPESSMKALQIADRLWKEGASNAEVCLLAARAYRQLAWQTHDEVGPSDLLIRRALACVAWGKAQNPESFAVEECLLADLLGYRPHARRTAKDLSKKGPDAWAAAYVLSQSTDLEKLLASTDAPIAAKYALVTLMGRPGQFDEWTKVSRTLVGSDKAAMLSVLGTGVYANSFNTRPQIARTILGGVLSELERRGGRPAPKKLTTGKAVDEFEAQLASLPVPATAGILFDRSIVDAYYRAQFYTAALHLGRHLTDSLASPRDAMEWARTLGQPAGGVGRDFALWYLEYAVLNSGRPLPQPAGSLDAGPEIRADLIADVVRQESAGQSASLQNRARIMKMIHRLDSRPLGRWEAGTFARQHLLDLDWAEKLFASAVEAGDAPTPYAAGWYAAYMGDKSSIEEALRDPGLSIDATQRLLERLGEDPASDAEMIHKAYVDLESRHPSNWNIVRDHTDFLMGRNKESDGVVAVNAWLKRNSKENGFPYIHARARLSLLYYKQAKFQEAYDAVEPVTESWQFNALDMTSRALSRLGKKEEAIRWARNLHQRYPQTPESSYSLAKVYFNVDEPAEAAKAAMASPAPANHPSWQQSVVYWLAALEKLDFAKVKLLLDSLEQAGMPPSARYGLALHASEQKYYAVGFECVSRFGRDGQISPQLLVLGYHCLKGAKSPDEAYAWLKEKTPDSLKAQCAEYAYQYREFELLWTLIDDAAAQPAEDFVWLLRAATLPKTTVDKEQRTQRLREHYQTPRESQWDLLGRYCLAMVEEDQVVEAAKNRQEAVAASYFIGARAENEGKFFKAADWYQTAFSLGDIDDHQWQWTMTRLSKWAAAPQSLSRLAGAQ
jgi:hypothetical protein